MGPTKQPEKDVHQAMNSKQNQKLKKKPSACKAPSKQKLKKKPSACKVPEEKSPLAVSAQRENTKVVTFEETVGEPQLNSFEDPTQEEPDPEERPITFESPTSSLGSSWDARDTQYCSVCGNARQGRGPVNCPHCGAFN